MTGPPPRDAASAHSDAIAPVLTFGSAGPIVVVTAGLHGWETSAIALAWEIADRLSSLDAAGTLYAKVSVLPVCNPGGTLAMSRFEPDTGADLNRIFPADGRIPSHSALSALAHRISASDIYIDLHSAGAATYWPHVLVSSRERLAEAPEFGLRFALLRGGGDHELGTSLSFAEAHGALAYCLEVAGGTRVEPSMVADGVAAVSRFLRHRGLLNDEALAEGDETVLYPCDPRTILKTKADGIFYSKHSVGRVVEAKEVIGHRIDSNTWQREPIVAGEPGSVIYLRSESRVRPGDTLAMILPPRESVNEGAKPKTLLV